MLWPSDAKPGHWDATCSRCLHRELRVGSRDAVIAELLADAWEFPGAELLWCLKCSREVREVQPPTNQRGVARRRR